MRLPERRREILISSCDDDWPVRDREVDHRGPASPVGITLNEDPDSQRKIQVQIQAV